jgi:hypothetical protein
MPANSEGSSLLSVGCYLCAISNLLTEINRHHQGKNDGSSHERREGESAVHVGKGSAA